MKRQLLAGRFGPDDRFDVMVGADEQRTYLQLVAGEKSLDHGIGGALIGLKRIGVFPSEIGIDLLVLAAHVHAADTRISRAEQQHVGFGIQLIREFMAQHPECVTKEFLEQVYTDVARAMNLERDYIHHCLKDGPILGYSAPEHIATAKYFANLRLGSVGLAAPFPEARHAFPWMSEQMELKKEKNFFEKRVTEYQAGGALSFDDHCPQHDQPGWSDPLA